VAIASLGVSVLAVAWVARRQSSERSHSYAALREKVPEPAIPGYATSNRCRSCHPQQYASWRRTYHSTMTQLVSEATVQGDFDDHQTRLFDQEYTFYRGGDRGGERGGNGTSGDGSREGSGDEFWIELPAWWRREAGRLLKTSRPDSNQRVVLITGSHHQQVYWVGVKDEILGTGAAWVREFDRFVPIDELFLKPSAHRPRGIQRWLGQCVRCHSTPAWREFPVRQSPGRRASPTSGTLLHVMAPLSLTDPTPERRSEVPTLRRMPELGISCEACHGPAEAHVSFYTSPVERYSQHLGSEMDTQVVNPSKLSAAESSQLCGSCHTPRSGFKLGTSGVLREARRRNPNVAWPDGMPRGGGRGYLGHINSPCYAGGEFSCISCHSMHNAPPEDQLAENMAGNHACVQCHVDFEAKIEEHTHHAAASSGSLCYNCHMPHTSYNLLKATRSHQVHSPNVQATIGTGRPNGCNLCHLDKTLGWTAQHLSSWYGLPAVELPLEERTISAAVLGVIKGDAMQRALYGWSMGWEPAQEASGRGWLAPFLAVLLDDSYTAVRVVATRSLSSLPGFENFAVDPWEVDPTSPVASSHAMERWEGMRDGPDRPGREVLLDARGKLDRATFAALREERDERPVQISE
jgi:predicted CXXCH cytochrome family protein